MNSSRLDDFARALATPRTRRQTMRLFVAGAAALTLPALRPRPVQAQGKVLCYDNPPNCFRFECHPLDECCVGPVEGLCPRFVGCCDPCSLHSCKCTGGGQCGPGDLQECCDKCCQKRGQGECCGHYVCCTKDTYCDRKRKICCPADPDDICRVPEPRCKKEVDDDVRFYRQSTCGKPGETADIADMKESAWASFGCQAFAELVLRRGRYAKCPQTTSDAACGPGGRCDKARGVCARPQCSDRSLGQYDAQADAASVEPAASDTRADALADAIATINRHLRAAAPRLAADQRRVDRILTVPPPRPPRPELADALLRYRRDVFALRARVAKVPARRPAEKRARALTLSVLDDVALGLSAFAGGAGSRKAAVAVREGNRAKAAFDKAARTTPRARKALGL